MMGGVFGHMGILGLVEEGLFPKSHLTENDPFWSVSVVI